MSLQEFDSIDALRRQSEEKRKALTQTVSNLRGKVTSMTSNTKANLSVAHLFRSIDRTARENPLQTAAIGAVVAYPLLGLVRRVPTPMLLAAAGLWFASQNGKRSADRIVAKGEAFSETAASAVSDLKDSLKRDVAPLTNAISEVHSKVQSASDAAKRAAHEFKNSMDTSVEKAAAAGRDMSNVASGAASNVKDSAAKFADNTRTGFSDLIEKNPLLVAGAGLAIGAFIASALPRSNVEDRAFGNHADQLKDEAKQMVSKGIVDAKTSASAFADDLSSAAQRDGLTLDRLKEATADVTENAKAVVERGIETALHGAAPVTATDNKGDAG